jgi:small subunit ribosomal protein S1
MAFVALIGGLVALPVVNGRMMQTSEERSEVHAEGSPLTPVLLPLLAKENAAAFQVQPGGMAAQRAGLPAVSGTPAVTMKASTFTISTPGKMTQAERMRSRYGGFVFDPEDTGEAAGFSYEEMQASMGDIPTFERGTMISGTVTGFAPSGAYVDMGGKSAAYVSNDDATLGKISRPDEVFEIGEKYDFYVKSGMDMDGMQRLSRKRLLMDAAWEKCIEAYTRDETLDAEVVAVNRGGAMVTIDGLRAFLPGSHYLPGNMPTEELIGKTLKVKFLDADREENKMVVSHRKAIAQEMAAALHVGAVFKGVVTAAKPYGVFVDLGGVSGLLHISQISADHVTNPGDILPQGSEVKVMVISENKAKGQVGLSTKTLEPEPGDMIRNPAKVYAEAEATAAKYAERKAEEAAKRAEAAEAFLVDASLFGPDLVEGSPDDVPLSVDSEDPGTVPEELLS